MRDRENTVTRVINGADWSCARVCTWVCGRDTRGIPREKHTYIRARVYKIGASGRENLPAWCRSLTIARDLRARFSSMIHLTRGVNYHRRCLPHIFSVTGIYERNERGRMQRGRLIWRIWRLSNVPAPAMVVLLKARRRCKTRLILENEEFAHQG